MGIGPNKEDFGTPVVCPYELVFSSIKEKLPVNVIGSYVRVPLDIMDVLCVERTSSPTGPCSGVEDSNNVNANESLSNSSAAAPNMARDTDTGGDGFLKQPSKISDTSERLSKQCISKKEECSVNLVGASESPSCSKLEKYCLIIRNRLHEINIPVYGNPKNHVPFLEPQIIDVFLSFICDTSLSSCFATCPHWFVIIYGYFQRLCDPVIEKFKRVHGGKFLEYESHKLSMQPLFTAQAKFIRLDLLIYCKVLPKCVNNCKEFGYMFKYSNERVEKKTLSAPGDSPSFTAGEIKPSGDPINGEKTNERILYLSQFRFETLQRNSRRKIWLERDLCRFHGDELMVATLASVPTINVYDKLEIPVNLCNAMGLVDTSSIEWMDVATVPESCRSFGQRCESEEPGETWYKSDLFQPATKETLQTFDFFGPQWRHVKTEFRGIDVVYSRSLYVADALGEVPDSRRWLGLDSAVQPSNAPIICPMTRLGLQHDRFSRHQTRKGDQIILYVIRGGGSVV